MPVCFSALAAHSFAKTGVRSGSGRSWRAEIVAAAPFLIPFSMRPGSYLWLVIFGLAALVHLLHGQFGVEGLVVYAAAVPVCTPHAAGVTADARPDRT
ncbi:MAG: hypothetical protein WA789_16420 [Candidatus Acidiferrum sp.]